MVLVLVLVGLRFVMVMPNRLGMPEAMGQRYSNLPAITQASALRPSRRLLVNPARIESACTKAEACRHATDRVNAARPRLMFRLEALASPVPFMGRAGR